MSIETDARCHVEDWRLYMSTETDGRVTVGPYGQECGNCYFWRGPRDSIRQQCMRYPPAGGHPPTGPFNWCGEWRSVRDPRP